MLKKYKLIIAGVVGILIISGIVLGVGMQSNELKIESIDEFSFTYNDANSKLANSLHSTGISMSSAIKLDTISDIEKYCSFFSNELIQEQVDFCTSTELRDSEGVFLGNIHMIGSRGMPKMVIAILQTDPFMTELDEIKTVFDVTIENLVCECWNEVTPNGLLSVNEWIDKQREFHTSNTKPTSRSNLLLNNINLEIELTTNFEGYLWKLIIYG